MSSGFEKSLNKSRNVLPHQIRAETGFLSVVSSDVLPEDRQDANRLAVLRLPKLINKYAERKNHIVAANPEVIELVQTLYSNPQKTVENSSLVSQIMKLAIEAHIIAYRQPEEAQEKIFSEAAKRIRVRLPGEQQQPTLHRLRKRIPINPNNTDGASL